MGISFVEKYENLSDDVLVERAANNDHEAAVALLKRYMPLIKSRASVFYNGAIEMDDLVQEGIISFYFGLRNFNSELSSFSTFARIVIDRGIISVIRALARKKHIPRELLISIEDNSFADESSPEDILIRAERFGELEDNIRQLLSKQEYRVLLLYLHNYSRSEIAQEMHVSEKSVSNAIYRIKSKLKNI